MENFLHFLHPLKVTLLRMQTRQGNQQKLLDTGLSLPQGLVYKPEFITPEEEWKLLAYSDTLPFKQSRLRGYTAKRRYLHFGCEYDYQNDSFISGEPLPKFLTPITRRIAKWLDIPRFRIAEALFLEYTPGSAIGWHVDRERFEHIIGVSFGGWCTMRFRKDLKRERDKILKLELEPRSAYIMQNEIRWQWQHSVPPTKTHRYSITFRTLPVKN